MYIERVPNRASPPAILLRESFRDGKRVRKRTLANLSAWPHHRIEALRAALKGQALTPTAKDPAFEIQRSLPHGHVAATLATLYRLGLHRLLAARPHPHRERTLAMIVARILEPQSKLATARGLDPDTLTTSLAETLRLKATDEDELYQAMDWLLTRQGAVEKALAQRHLAEGTFVLYDVSSTYFEGHTCPLAQLGHPRDNNHGMVQIVFGLLCNAEGCPVAVEVFAGNTGDPKTLPAQIEKIRGRFQFTRIVLVGDRGMITDARIRKNLRGVEGLEWITALRAPAIQQLVAGGALQLSLFDQRDLAEITAPDYPGERLVVCKNPLLATERARKREALLKATERNLDQIVAATKRAKRPLRSREKIGARVGRVLGRHKVGKHFLWEATDESFQYARNPEKIAQEAALDGFYVIRTPVPADRLTSEDVVGTYKKLAGVERAFRSIKTVDLEVRPIHHRREDRVRAHVFLCMLAYYVQWHMRRRLAPMLFDDEDPAAGAALRSSVVAPAQRSPSAQRKASTKRTPEGQPVHSFRTLLEDLGTLCKNRIAPKGSEGASFEVYTTPTPIQQRAFDLLEVSPRM